ncbi:MAG: PorP/SprF family type IX secretion system membrane protein, partial [Saprospiraceae bacterium]
MIKNLRHFIALAACFIALASSAQDIHFSQFYMSPLNLNPALTGVMNCNIRATAIYRNQWASVLGANAFKTFGASYDQKIPVGREDYFGVGGNLWADKAGESNFSTISGLISGSYSKKIGGYREKASYIVAGVQIGASQRSIDFLKIKWGTQHNGDGTVNPTLPSGENFTRDRFIFADINVGLLYFNILDKYNSFYAGAAFNHLNKPNQSFDDGPAEPLYNKMTFHAGGEFRMTDGLALVPGLVVFTQGPS